ncbi:MAG: ArsR family transcriptional regulator [Candidatus Poseidoniaceae archaeon]
MGEVRTRRLVALSLVMLLVLLVPTSAEETSSVRLEIDVMDDNTKPWYGLGDSVLLASSIVNDGAATSITEDPSCGTVIRVSNADGTTVVDESVGCRGQSRGLDIGSGVTALEQHEWDLTDQDGALVAPGIYSITVELAGSGLSSTTEVMVQQNAELPTGLIFSASIAHREDVLSIGEPFVVAYELHNPTSEAIDLRGIDACQLLISFEQQLLGPSCNAGETTIDPYAVLSLGHSMLQATVADLSTLTIQTPDAELIGSFELSVQDAPVQSTPLEASIKTLSTSFVQGELFDGSITLENDGTENELLRFTNTCRASYWIMDNSGVVFDSLDQANCRNAELDVVVGASSQSTFPLQTWAFVDEVGCSMLSGDYVLVAELPEFGYASSMDVDFRRVQSVDCGTTSEPLPSLTVELDENDDPVFELHIVGMEEQTDIQWLEICKASLQLWNLDLTEKIIEKNVLCSSDERIDQALRLSSDDVLIFELEDLNTFDYESAEYRVRIDMATDQDLILEHEFSWPLNVQVEETVVVEEDTSEESAVVVLGGVWSGVLTPDGTCWMLEENSGVVHMLADSIIESWSPERGSSGTYQAQLSEASAACARFTAESYTFVGILQEIPFAEEEPVSEEATVVESEAVEEETLPDWAPQAVTVLTVSAVLSMLGFAAFNNEALRISTTLTGLWLLGLIGKTSETSDGRFQRGRLLGYLTANPGCHFRALLSALEMSNGQLSHHLRVLEQEESVWRRKDGRLVRYYPLTNTLHPLLEDDALPVPILAPDPLSLQGKILVLLDHDSQMGDFPTQAELAKRLDKSQQLISHHLRTLEKYGLIEGRRMGMRNRYKLTKEAMFLLETSEAYVQNEMNL